MKRFKLILWALVLLLVGCTGKDIMVTTPVDFTFKIDQVKATKVKFTVDISNPDAHYGYFIANLNMVEVDFAHMTDKQLADYWRDLQKEDYEARAEQRPFGATLADVSCYRGNRTLKRTYLSTDTSYRLVVFQVNPKDFTILGDVQGVSFQTPNVEESDLDFTLQIDGSFLVITPSDNDCSYYWDYESEERIYDDYITPFGYLYDVVDMYEDYGFIGNVLTKGPVHHDLAQDHLKDGAAYVVVADAYDPKLGELSYPFKMLRFEYRNGTFYTFGEENDDHQD